MNSRDKTKIYIFDDLLNFSRLDFLKNFFKELAVKFSITYICRDNLINIEEKKFLDELNIKLISSKEENILSYFQSKSEFPPKNILILDLNSGIQFINFAKSVFGSNNFTQIIYAAEQIHFIKMDKDLENLVRLGNLENIGELKSIRNNYLSAVTYLLKNCDRAVCFSEEEVGILIARGLMESENLILINRLEEIIELL